MDTSDKEFSDSDLMESAPDKKHVSEALQDDASKKIDAKLVLLEGFIKTGEANFKLPKKISTTFFSDKLGEELGIGSVSRSSKTWKRPKVKERIDKVLKDAQKALRDSQRKSAKKDPVKELKATVKEQSLLIEKLTNELIEQRRIYQKLERENQVKDGRIKSLENTQNITPLTGKR